MLCLLLCKVSLTLETLETENLEIKILKPEYRPMTNHELSDQCRKQCDHCLTRLKVVSQTSGIFHNVSDRPSRPIHLNNTFSWFSVWCRLVIESKLDFP